MSEAHLWAPWRMQYIRQIDDASDPGASFLVDYWAQPDKDAEHMVLHRTSMSMILLNRYPYTNGHLLVAPGECIADLPLLSPQQRHDLFECVTLAERLLQVALNPQGLNIGINLGRCAGAGVPGHLHVHIVPRWGGDTNFITVVGRIRVIPDALEAMAAQYRETVAGMAIT